MSRTNPVISVEQVGKTYRIWSTPVSRLLSPAYKSASRFAPGSAGSALHRHANSLYRDFHALQNISFSIKPGESWGLIGRNGSGKSTLLQIIAGTLQASTGQARVRGRVAALLELGSGFNPDFTGRENVYLNATVLGLKRAEIDAKFDEIAAFADIGDFIDQPIKTYSSGMMMRLGFAVQTAVSPDVLIVDEALSVGDTPFQAKCFNRIKSLIDRGVAVLLVSHDLGTVKNFCTHALWLHEGREVAQGIAGPVCDAYQRDCMRASGVVFEENPQAPANAAPAEVAPTLTGSTTVSANSPAEVSPSAKAASKEVGWQDRSSFESNARLGRQGSGPVRLRNFYFASASDAERNSMPRFDEPLTACYELFAATACAGLFQIGLTIKTPQGTEVMSICDRKHNLTLAFAAGETKRLQLHCTLPLKSGKYYATTSLFLFPAHARFVTGTYDYFQSTVMDRIEYACFFEIAAQTHEGIYGPVHQEGRLAWVDAPPAASQS